MITAPWPLGHEPRGRKAVAASTRSGGGHPVPGPVDAGAVPKVSPLAALETRDTSNLSRAPLLTVPCNYLVETGPALEHQTGHSCMMGRHWFDMLGYLAGLVVLGKAILPPSLNGVLNMVVVLAVLGFVTSFAVSLSAELSTAFCGGDGKAPGIHARAWCLGPYLLAPSFPMHPEAPQDCLPLLCV